MTKLLISVTNVAEANIALTAGADIIDLKDPSAGALGALPLTQIRQIVDYVQGARFISATIGDLPMQTDLIVNAVQALTHEKIDFIKIGFFSAQEYAACLQALKPFIQNGVKLIAVLFAEHQYADDLIDDIHQAGFFGVMIDTAVKNQLTLFDHSSAETRQQLTQRVLKKNMTLGLAGSLTIEHVPQAMQLNPSYIGFRGGVCENNERKAKLSASMVKAVCKLL